MLQVVVMGKVVWVGDMKTSAKGSPYRTVLVAPHQQYKSDKPEEQLPAVLCTYFGKTMGFLEVGDGVIFEGDLNTSIRKDIKTGEDKVSLSCYATKFEPVGLAKRRINSAKKRAEKAEKEGSPELTYGAGGGEPPPTPPTPPTGNDIDDEIPF